MRRNSIAPISSLLLISIHASTRDATSSADRDSAHARLFQSTHPRGMRHPLIHWLPLVVGFQSTHPRGMRLSTRPRQFGPVAISIHASTRDATQMWRWRILRKRFQSTHPREMRHGSQFIFSLGIISIHASTRDATKLISQKMSLNISFQSTHPRGMRPSTHQPYLIAFCISIHASTRDATLAKKLISRSGGKFQSTHPRGMRPEASLLPLFRL